ncbi:hypothetical protein [Paenibacillus sp. JDR-2]|uniref:hypothetical protein n=1 Tax=Paenibacillus sp. (strain JDR-2) TaxID=324057 RepID=UPI00167FA4EB|nr:hypothetical protein [Paenibacillus sp. JDR-2]
MGYIKKKKTVSSKNKKISKKNKRFKKIKTAKKPFKKRRRKHVPAAVETLNLAPLFASPLDPSLILSKADEEVWRRILQAQPKGYALPDSFTFQRLKQVISPIIAPGSEGTVAQ